MARTAKNDTASTNGTEEKEHVDLASRIQEVDTVGGYVTSKKVASIFSDAIGKDVPVTTVNNLAYAGKIEVIKIGGIFLFKLESVNAYIPTLLQRGEKSAEKKQQEEIKAKQQKAKALFKQYVNDALAKGEMPDLDAIKRELGI
jgi:hypothetical protein